MRVSGIDHVNILTHDLDETAAFYERVLGLVRADNMVVAPGFRGAWMRDETGAAIVHLVWKDPASERYEGYSPGQFTNAVHHVAFRCDGFDEMQARLVSMGIAYRINDRQHGSIRQIFLTDPNAVNIELNFAAN